MNYALITGASSGIGLHIAMNLYGRGYSIVIVSNRPDENLSAKELIEKQNKRPGNQDIRLIDIDLSSADAAETIFSTLQEWGITIEVLVCNAGMLLFSTLNRTSCRNIEKILNLHCLTTTKLISLTGKGMIERQKGYILITSSSTAWMPFPTISHYGSTKAYLKNLSQAIWYEYRRYNVQVTTIYPGAVDTPLYRLSDRKRKALRLLGIMQSPEYVAKKAVRRLFNHKRQFIPGLFTKFTIVLCRCIPKKIFAVLFNIPSIKKIWDEV